MSSTNSKQQIHQRAQNGKQRLLPLVGSFEENVLNNRLQPIRVVEGYKAEVRAASSYFQPRPLSSSVRVSFYSAGDSFPYLSQLNIGYRGYRIPQKGTLQVTLFNPYGTLVKLFILLYDLQDMPPNSQTFLRQKTVFVPNKTANEVVKKPDLNNNNTVPNKRQQQQQEEEKIAQEDEEAKLKSSSKQHSKNCRVRYLIQLK